MVPADADALFALWLATPGMGLNTTDDSAEGIARFLRRNPTTCFVAEQDGRRGYIYHTCVRRENRRAGLGRALVETALAALRAEDIHKVALVAYARNTDGNAFWERMGFTVREDLVYRDHSLTELVRIDP